MLYQGSWYHHHKLVGKLGGVMLFIVPTAHWVAAMTECHHDAGYQGQQWMLYLLQDQFWWPSQQLQTMHTTWRHLCQSINAAQHCHHSFGATSHRLHEHWDDYGAAPATKHGQHPGFLWSLYETHHGLHDPDQTWRPLLNFNGRDTSWSSEPKPSPWVIKVPILKVALLKSYVNSLAYGRLWLQLTMLRPKDKLSDLTKCLCAW